MFRDMEKKYCVYKHLKDGQVVYVGSGLSTRPKAFQGRHREWVLFFGKKNPEVVVVQEGMTKVDALKLESQLIRELQPFLNKTSGREENAIQQIRVYPSDYPRIKQHSFLLNKKYPELITFLLDSYEKTLSRAKA